MSELARQGKIPHQQGGDWNPEKVRARRGKNLDQCRCTPLIKNHRLSHARAEPEDFEVQSKPASDKITPSEAKHRHEIAKAAKAWLKASKLKGKLVDIDEEKDAARSELYLLQLEPSANWNP